MATKRWHYNVSFGQPGCLPDSTYGAFTGTTRTELSALIKDALEFYGLPKSLAAEFGLLRAWRHIKRSGSSVVHRYMDTKGGPVVVRWAHCR